MALDQIPDTHQEMRSVHLSSSSSLTFSSSPLLLLRPLYSSIYMFMYYFVFRLRILQNICTLYVRLGQYSDAINTYEYIMNEKKERADFKTG